jgi:hypothetical protein
MEDVERGLALHPWKDGELREVVRRLVDAVPPKLQRDGPVLVLAQEDRPAWVHPGAIAHRLGDDDLAFGTDFRRPDPIERDPGTDRRQRLGLTHARQYNHNGQV